MDMDVAIFELVSKWGFWALIVQFLVVGWLLNEDKRKALNRLQDYYNNMDETGEESSFHFSMQQLLVKNNFTLKSINYLLTVCSFVLMGILITLLNQVND